MKASNVKSTRLRVPRGEHSALLWCSGHPAHMCPSIALAIFRFAMISAHGESLTTILPMLSNCPKISTSVMCPQLTVGSVARVGGKEPWRLTSDIYRIHTYLYAFMRDEGEEAGAAHLHVAVVVQNRDRLGRRQIQQRLGGARAEQDPDFCSRQLDCSPRLELYPRSHAVPQQQAQG
jgi:hypothetical protein